MVPQPSGQHKIPSPRLGCRRQHPRLCLQAPTLLPPVPALSRLQLRLWLRLFLAHRPALKVHHPLARYQTQPCINQSLGRFVLSGAPSSAPRSAQASLTFAASSPHAPDRIVDTITSTLPALEPRLHQLLALSPDEIASLAFKPKNHSASSATPTDVIDMMLSSAHTPPQALLSSIDFLSNGFKTGPTNALTLYMQRLVSLLADDKVSIHVLLPRFKLNVLVDALAQVATRSVDRFEARLVEILDVPTPIAAVCASGAITCESVIAVLGRLVDPEARSKEMFEYVASRVEELEPQVESADESIVFVDSMDTDRPTTPPTATQTTGNGAVELEDGELVDDGDNDVDMDIGLGNLDQHTTKTNDDDAESCSSDMSMSSMGDGGTRIIEDFSSSRSASPFIPVSSNAMPHLAPPAKMPRTTPESARVAPWRTSGGTAQSSTTEGSVNVPKTSDTPAKSKRKRKRKRAATSTSASSTSSPATSVAPSLSVSPPPSAQPNTPPLATDQAAPPTESELLHKALPGSDRQTELIDLRSDSDQEYEDDKGEDMDLCVDESPAFRLLSPPPPSQHTPNSASSAATGPMNQQFAPWQRHHSKQRQRSSATAPSTIEPSKQQQYQPQRPLPPPQHQHPIPSRQGHATHSSHNRPMPARATSTDPLTLSKTSTPGAFGYQSTADPSQMVTGTPTGPSAPKRARLHHDLVTSPWHTSSYSLTSSSLSASSSTHSLPSAASPAPTPTPKALDPELAAAQSAVADASSRLAQARALESQSRSKLDSARSEHDLALAALAAAQLRVSRAQAAIDLSQKAFTDAQGVCARLAADEQVAKDRLAEVQKTALEREKKLQIERLKERQAVLERNKRVKAEMRAKVQVAHLVEAVRKAVDKVAPPAVAMAVEEAGGQGDPGDQGPLGQVVDLGPPKTVVECIKVDADWVRADRLATVTSVARDRPEWFLRGACLADELNDEISSGGLDARRWEAELVEDMERKGRSVAGSVGAEEIGVEGRVPLGAASMVPAIIATRTSGGKRRSSMSSVMTNPMVAKVLAAFGTGAPPSSEDDRVPPDSSPTMPTSVLPSEIIPCSAELVPGATCNDPVCVFTHLDDLDQPSKWLPKQVVTRIKQSSNPMALSLLLRRKLANANVFPTERDVVTCVLEALDSVLPVISLPEPLPNGGAAALPSARASLPIRTIGVLHKVTNGPLAKPGPRRFWQTYRTVEEWAELVEECPKELSEDDWLEYAIASLPTWSNVATLNDNKDQSYHAALQVLVLGLKHCLTAPNLWELFMELLMRKTNSRDHIQRHIGKAKERVPDQWTHYWRVLDTLRDDSKLYAKTLIHFVLYTLARKADPHLIVDTLVAAAVALDEDAAVVKRAQRKTTEVDDENDDVEPVMPVSQFLLTVLCATNVDSLKEQFDNQVDLESYPACVPDDEQGFQATLLFQQLAPNDLALIWLIFAHAIVHDSIPAPSSPVSTSPLLVPGSEHVVAQRNLFVLRIDGEGVDVNRVLIAKHVLEKLCHVWQTLVWADEHRDVDQEARSAFGVLVQNLDMLLRVTSGSHSVSLPPEFLNGPWPVPADCWDLSVNLPETLVTSPAAWNAVAAHAATVRDRDRILNALVNAAHCVMVDYKVHPIAPPSQDEIDNALNVYRFLLGLTYSFSSSASPPTVSQQSKSMYKWHWINFLLFQALVTPSTTAKGPSTTRLLHLAVSATIDMPLMWRELLIWAALDSSGSTNKLLDPMVLTQLITSSVEPHKHSTVLDYTEHGLTHPFVMPTPVHDASHLRFVFGTILPRVPAPVKRELVQWLIDHAPSLRPPADVFLVAAQLLHGTQSVGNNNGERVVKLLVSAIERGARLDGVWDLVLSFPWDKKSKEKIEEFRAESKLSVLPDHSATA
ncbi:hypothetical protein BCR44DRAFT_41560 [Catenaria anguillulae PL171]|uniref:Uncharacterized protein n=1 Tax=Catenaria anguillulae PL171 TaxID=765915 RepID=A0A1Y2H8W7_9FUNG|nr:hypothetical protein BCR44DRAFT_41560 [Catenaria anguillulae PL171]